MIVALTDNNNRTAAELRFILSRNGGSLGAPGSARYMFERDEEGAFRPTMDMPVEAADLEKLQQLQEALLENEDTEEVFMAVTLEDESVE
jgi:transcriptional/translational regulatory protein YebC/TACO1